LRAKELYESLRTLLSLRDDIDVYPRHYAGSICGRGMDGRTISAVGGSYVYNSGNLVLDLLYNLMLEATGRLQKCRIFEMSDNKTLWATVSYLIARDAAHEAAFAKALGVNWAKLCPSQTSTLRNTRR
jgi:Mn-containing catalase